MMENPLELMRNNSTNWSIPSTVHPVFFSKKLGKSLSTRNTPKLHFVYDSGFDHSDEIEKLIKQNQKNVEEIENKLKLDSLKREKTIVENIELYLLMFV